VPLAVALGATCILDMTDSYGDGWNGAEWSAPGFGQTFSLAGGEQGTKSFVVQFQPPSPPPSPPSPPLSPPGTFTTKASLQTAVSAFNHNPAAATAAYGLIADWDVSAITDMSYLFYNSKNFNADISSWDTSGVTTIKQMFRYAVAFNQPLSWKTSSVTTMSGMFWGASAFNQPLSWDTSSVTDISAMFYVTELHGFNQPLSWDTSNVKSMRFMFTAARAFNQPLSFDTSSVTDMTSMFNGVDSLSAANKLSIRCAWVATSAFTSAGYGGSSWGPGSCTSG